MENVSVQVTSDPNTRAFNTTFEMVEKPESAVRGQENRLSEFGRLFLVIKGVVQVQVGTYLLLVTKAPLFDWELIQPQVKDILNTFARSQEQLRDVSIL